MKICFVGINGVSMSALARFAAARGHEVTGSDLALGGHSRGNVHGCSLVVYSGAVPPDNCELDEARRLGIPIMERAEFLARLAAGYDTTVAVAGCHGKSTAAAMTGRCLAPLDPTVHVGAEGCSRVGGKKVFVTEACEYRRSFLRLSPDIGVVLGTGYDHPDCYATKKELLRAYGGFAARCRTVIVNGDDPGCAGFDRTSSFGMGAHNRCRAACIVSRGGKRRFDLLINGRLVTRVTLGAPGAHNVMNALAALAVTDALGADMTAAVAALRGFTGIPRRFERLGARGGAEIYTDYAHHPDEIAATLALAKELFPSVTAVFQPHTYSRTRAMADGFSDALAAADTVVLAPIYAAREQPDPGVSSHDICRRLVQKGKRAYCFDTFAEITDFCARLDTPAIFFLGAGNIDSLAREYAAGEAEL